MTTRRSSDIPGTPRYEPPDVDGAEPEDPEVRLELELLEDADEPA